MNLPPLPNILGLTSTRTEQIMRAYARAAVQADRAQRGEPVAWQWLNTAHFRKNVPASATWSQWRPLYASPPPAAQAEQGKACRTDGRCQYAIDHGAEGLGHCPTGKCVMPAEQAEPLAWEYHGRFGFAKIHQAARPLYAAPPPAAQVEPVAWHWVEDPFGANERHVVFDDPKDPKWTPLYSAPPPAEQRKPLTDEQIVTVLVRAGCTGTVKLSYVTGPYDVTSVTWNAVSLVREVERAHGIGKEPT